MLKVKQVDGGAGEGQTRVVKGKREESEGGRATGGQGACRELAARCCGARLVGCPRPRMKRQVCVFHLERTLAFRFCVSQVTIALGTSGAVVSGGTCGNGNGKGDWLS